MLARHSSSDAISTSDAIMIDVDFLNFGKLISSADGLAAPEGLGVTSRSRGLKADDDGELRLNALLEVQVFSPAMIDQKQADKGLLLVRTLPGASTGSKRRTVFVRARFRQESTTSSDNRPHQQASIWVANADTWFEHPAAILTKVGSELEAEPDRADDGQRFGAPPKKVLLHGAYASGEQATHEKWKYAYFSILDMVLRELGDTRPNDREVTFGSDVFDTEAEFLTVVGSALQELPLDFERWKDIRIGSGMRSSGGLNIRYLPSEENTMKGAISPERIVSIKYRRDSVWGRHSVRETKTVSPPMPSNRPADYAPAPAATTSLAAAPLPADPLARPAPAAAETPIGPAPGQQRFSALSAKEAARDFQIDLMAYRRGPNETTAQKLIATAAQVDVDARKSLELAELSLVFDAIRSVTRGPSALLPLGTLYDRVRLVSRLPRSDVTDSWFQAFWQAIVRAGVLLPTEQERLLASQLSDRLAPKDELRKVYKNSQELRSWLGQVRTDPAGAIAIPDLSFLGKLRDRLGGISAGLSAAHDQGINEEVLVRSGALLNAKELITVHRDLLLCMATNLFNTHNYYRNAASDGDRAENSSQTQLTRTF